MRTVSTRHKGKIRIIGESDLPAQTFRRAKRIAIRMATEDDPAKNIKSIPPRDLAVLLRFEKSPGAWCRYSSAQKLERSGLLHFVERASWVRASNNQGYGWIAALTDKARKYLAEMRKH